MDVLQIIMHDHRKYCVNNNPNEMKQKCNDVCFTNNNLYFGDFCDECIMIFYDTNKINIDAEISKGNDNAMNFRGRIAFINEQYDEMKKYYLQAIEHNNINAMHNLSAYYTNTEINNELAEKYLLCAVNLGSLQSMNLLAIFYQSIKNYDEMEKYYKMAIDRGYMIAAYNLASYYQKIKNYDEMKKYYLIALDAGISMSANNLGKYCYEIENYDEMKKYLLMAIDKNVISAMNNLGYYYETNEKNYDEMKKYYIMAINSLTSSCKNTEEHYDTINSLASYYNHIEKNYDLMKKYYMIGIYGLYPRSKNKNCTINNELNQNHIQNIEFGLDDYIHFTNEYNFFQMYYLGRHYERTEKNIKLAHKYFLMALENENYFKKNKNRLADYIIIELISKIGVVKLYSVTSNKKHIMKILSEQKRNELMIFLNNTINEICQSCFIEDLCCFKNDVYLCGLCY